MHGSHEQIRARPGGLSWCKATSSSSVGLRNVDSAGKQRGLMEMDSLAVETEAMKRERVPTSGAGRNIS